MCDYGRLDHMDEPLPFTGGLQRKGETMDGMKKYRIIADIWLAEESMEKVIEAETKEDAIDIFFTEVSDEIKYDDLEITDILDITQEGETRGESDN